MKKYCILGGGGSFGLHSAFYLLENVKLKKVISVGRNFLREEPFSLNITRHEKFEYHSRHIYHEQDLLLELLDKEKPEVIINLLHRAKVLCRGNIPGDFLRQIVWHFQNYVRN